MRQRRPGSNEFYDIVESPLGTIYLIFSSALLIGISFTKPDEILFRHKESKAAVKKELAEYFKNGLTEFKCKTAFVTGTVFEKIIWETLQKVPYGETRTYKWLAEEIDRPKAFRSVGNALGKNPIPIVFPCHRIIESDGSIGGYSQGIGIKRRLLDIEYYSKQAKT